MSSTEEAAITTPARGGARAWLALAGLLASIGASAAVQWELITPSWVAWMPALWGATALLGSLAWRFSAAVVGARTEPLDASPPRGLRVFLSPFVAAAFACLLLGIGLIYADDLSRPGAALWALGIGALPAAAAWSEGRNTTATSRARWARIGGVALVVVALGVRLHRIEEIPAKYLDDEGAVSDWGLSYLHGTQVFGQHVATAMTLFRNGATAYPLLGSYVHALVMQVAGETIFGSRLTAVIAGVLCVLVIYSMLLAHVRPWAAFLAALLFAFCHTHLFWSRFGTPQSLTTLAVAVVFWLTLRGLRSGRYSTFLAAGTVLGLAQYFYEGARFFVPVLIAFFAILAVSERGFLRRRAVQVVFMALAAAWVFAPIGLWYLEFPQELLARSRGVLIFAQPDYIASRYPGLDTTGVVLAQLQRAFEGFAYRGDGANFFSLRGPIIDPVTRTLLLAGVFAIFAFRDRLRLLVFLWIWVPILIVCIPTVDPPSMTRLIQVVPALFVVVGLVLDRVGSVADRAAGRPGRIAVAVVAALATVYGVRWDLLEFFDRYPREHVADAQTVGGLAARRLAGDAQVRVLSGFSFFTPTVRFLGRGLVGEDLPRDAVPLPGRGLRDALVFLSADDPTQAERLRATYPGAEEEEHRNSRGDLLLRSFRIPAVALDEAAGPDAAWRLPDARFGLRGGHLGEIFSPRALAVDTQGRLFVADTFNRRLQAFAADGRALFEFGGPKSGADKPGMPISLAFLADSTLVVLRREPFSLERYDGEGKRLADVPLKEAPGAAVAVARAPGGLYLLDASAAVVKLRTDGTIEAKAGGRGSGPGQFDNPMAMAATEDGRLFIYDAGNRRIVRLSPSFVYEGEWPLELPNPLGQAIAVGPAGDERVYVANASVGAVQRFTTDGKLEWLIGLKGDYPGNLAWPLAVALDGGGDVFLADENRGQIFRYDLSRLPVLTRQK